MDGYLQWNCGVFPQSFTTRTYILLSVNQYAKGNRV